MYNITLTGMKHWLWKPCTNAWLPGINPELNALSEFDIQLA